jgi:hypothetical protein
LTGGKLAGIPFALQLEKKTTKFGVAHVVNIIFQGDHDSLITAVTEEVNRRRLLAVDIEKVEKTAAQITADTDTPEDITAEFYPESFHPTQHSTGNTYYLTSEEQKNQDEGESTKNTKNESESIQAAHIAIKELLVGINPYAVKNSLKKWFGKGITDITQVTDYDKLREYYRVHGLQKQKGEGLWEKPKPKEEAPPVDSPSEEGEHPIDTLSEEELNDMEGTIKEWTPDVLAEFQTFRNENNILECKRLYGYALDAKEEGR